MGDALRALIVDDDPVVANVLQRMLEQASAAVRVATGGGSALSLLDDGPADVMFVDLNMPDMDGIELLRHLGGRDPVPHVAIMSAEGADLLRAASRLGETYRLSVVGVVTKPMRREQLDEILRRVRLGGHDGQQAAAREGSLSPDELREAIDNGWLSPVYQPKVDTRTLALEGVEVLARLLHPTRGVLTPDLFVPVAESSGLIHDLTRAIVRVTFAQIAQWTERGRRHLTSINVSMLDLEDETFHDFIVEEARRTGVDPQLVALEVTETRVVGNVSVAIENLARLRLRGFRVSLDDYGTGASTLEQIQRLPISELKIDRAFVSGASEDGQTMAMLRATVAMSQELGLTTVAEGVEVESELQLCRDLGVDLVQGYLLARPMTSVDFDSWLEVREA